MKTKKHKPTKLKLLQGTAQKCRMNPNEPKPRNGIPPCPRWLCLDAKREWRAVSKELYQLGVLTVVDRAALAAYCQCFARWKQAEETLAKSGILIKTTNGNVIQSPLVGVANKAMLMMHRFLTEFGMSPSSRASIKAEKPVSRSNLEKFLNSE